MSIIAIAPSAITSKRRLAVELARRLVEAGHRVVMIERSADAPDEGFDRRILDMRPSLDAPIRRPRVIAERRARRAAAADFEPAMLADLLAELGADLLLIDIEEHEFTIAALASGLDMPVAVLSSFFELWPVDGMAPLDSPLPQGTDLRGKGRVTLAWWRTWVRMGVGDVRRRLTGDRPDRMAVIHTIARGTGVRRAMTRRQWLHPFVPRHLPIFQLTAAELDLPHTPPANVRSLGPLLTRVEAASLDSVADRALVASLDEARAAGRPIVLCVSGAFMSGPGTSFLDRIAEVARRCPEAHFVVATGTATESTALRAVPNIHALEWVPQREVLSVANAAIVHAGLGTLNECAVAGVPMVVLPFRINDQLGNTARVEHHGIGVVGDRDDDAPTIANHLRRVLDDPAMRRRLDDLRVLLDRYEHEDVAVRAVEDLLRPHGTHVTDDSHRRP